MLSALERAAHVTLRAIGGRSLHVDTSSGPVHTYELLGRGEGTFVLLHGMASVGSSYARVAALLRRSARRIVVPDLPGHGRSVTVMARGRARPPMDRATLSTGLCEALDALLDVREPAVVLGTSLGGAGAIIFAMRRPERVRALVLASPAGAPLTGEELETLRRRFTFRSRDDARRFLRELLHAPPWYLRLVERSLAERLGGPLVREFLGSVRAEDTFTEAELAALLPKVTLVWGGSDRVLPRSGLAFFRRALPPGTTFLEVEELGHSPHFERPAWLVGLLVAAYAESAHHVST